VKVLICSADPHRSRLAEINLQRQGWQVTCVGSGKDAVDQIRAELPDMLFVGQVPDIEVLRSVLAGPEFQNVQVLDMPC
jgi:DNA-binding response OmpR family regulator